MRFCFSGSIILSHTQLPQCFGWLWGATSCATKLPVQGRFHTRSCPQGSHCDIRWTFGWAAGFWDPAIGKKLADDQTIIRWQPEIKRKHMEHWNIAPFWSGPVLRARGRDFFEVSDGQCQNHLEIPWIQHSALPARRPWWHRDWGCEGTWTARSSACSLHSG